MNKPVARIAVVNSHPIQYFAPQYAFLNSQDDLDVTVFYLSDSSLRGAKDPGFGQSVQWDVDLLDGYRPVFISGAERRQPAGFFSLVAPQLWKAIRAGRFDAVLVHGHMYAANFIAMAAAKSVGTKVFMRTETTLRLQRRRLKAVLRRSCLSLLYRWCDGVLAIGSLNAEFYRSVGVPDAKITIVPYSVDNARFIRESMLTAGERQQIRADLGVTGSTPIVVYASKFQRRKHPDSVIAAAHALAGRGVALHVVMIGSGEMETELRELADLGPATVTFPGFINQSMLPSMLAACDVFVLPSEEEPWGLIVNEAMCAGLPVVVGKDAGCVPDLVNEGDNGFEVIPGDVAQLTEVLAALVANPERRTEMSARSREIVRGWGFERCADGWRRALQPQH